MRWAQEEGGEGRGTGRSGGRVVSVRGMRGGRRPSSLLGVVGRLGTDRPWAALPVLGWGGWVAVGTRRGAAAAAGIWPGGGEKGGNGGWYVTGTGWGWPLRKPR